MLAGGFALAVVAAAGWNRSVISSNGSWWAISTQSARERPHTSQLVTGGGCNALQAVPQSRDFAGQPVVQTPFLCRILWTGKQCKQCQTNTTKPGNIPHTNTNLGASICTAEMHRPEFIVTVTKPDCSKQGIELSNFMLQVQLEENAIPACKQ